MLGDSRGLVLKGNDAIVVADNLRQAVVLAWYLQDAARVELDVMSAGSESSPCFTPEEVVDRAIWNGGSGIACGNTSSQETRIPDTPKCLRETLRYVNVCVCRLPYS